MFIVKVMKTTDEQPDEEILGVRSGGPRAEELVSQWVWGTSRSTAIHSPPQKRSEHHYLGVLWGFYGGFIM